MNRFCQAHLAHWPGPSSVVPGPKAPRKESSPSWEQACWRPQ